MQSKCTINYGTTANWLLFKSTKKLSYKQKHIIYVQPCHYPSFILRNEKVLSLGSLYMQYNKLNFSTFQAKACRQELEGQFLTKCLSWFVFSYRLPRLETFPVCYPIRGLRSTTCLKISYFSCVEIGGCKMSSVLGYFFPFLHAWTRSENYVFCKTKVTSSSKYARQQFPRRDVKMAKCVLIICWNLTPRYVNSASQFSTEYFIICFGAV